jgi:2-keto-4-pentenoate hydratase
MVALTDSQCDELAQSLYQARESRAPIEPLTDSHPELSMWDAYAIQRQLIGLLTRGGDSLGAFKLGLTSKAMQELLKVDRPDFSPVLESAIYRGDSTIDASCFIAPRVEAEIGILLQADLAGPDCTTEDVLAAAAGAVAAIEIVDSRIRDWRIKLADTIADLASNGAIVISENVVPLDFDPRLIGMVFTQNGQMVATSAGAAAMGDPLQAVAWLVNTLAEVDETLRAGTIVMTGALHAMVPATAGDEYVAEFDHLGSLTLRVK